VGLGFGYIYIYIYIGPGGLLGGSVSWNMVWWNQKTHVGLGLLISIPIYIYIYIYIEREREREYASEFGSTVFWKKENKIIAEN